MRIIPLLVALPFLAACASLTEEQCLSGDWASIGFNDGAQGRTQDYISRHFDACGDVGVIPDTQAWLSGRAQGLLQYCTQENAYSEGRRGRDLSPVCPAEYQNTLNHFYGWGAEYYHLSQSISEIEDEIDAIRRIIVADLSHIPLTPPESLQLINLNSQVRRLEREIRRLEQRRVRYATAPY